LVIHAASGDQDRPALARRLTMLRAVAPEMQVVIDEVILDGDRAAVRLTTWPGGEERLIARAGYHGTPVGLRPGAAAQ
jgi:hypothetical protein